MSFSYLGFGAAYSRRFSYITVIKPLAGGGKLCNK